MSNTSRHCVFLQMTAQSGGVIVLREVNSLFRVNRDQAKQFVHRYTENGKVESICLACLLTIWRCRTSQGASLRETEHLCPPNPVLAAFHFQLRGSPQINHLTPNEQGRRQLKGKALRETTCATKHSRVTISMIPVT